MLPGTYAFPLDIPGGSQQKLRIVGTGATAAATTSITIANSANVEIRGLNTVSSIALHCTPSTAVPTLTWRDAMLTKIDNAGSLFELNKCDLTLSNVEVSMGGGEFVAAFEDDGRLVGDRLYIHGSNTHYFGLYGKRDHLQLTNSLLVNVSFSIGTTDTAAPGSFVRMGYNTLVATGISNTSPGCVTGNANLVVVWENSIIAPLQATGDAIDGPGCMIRNVLVTRQAIVPPSVTVGNPQFVNPAQNDFHLKATSPAVDAGVQSIFQLNPETDLEGRIRPQGAAADLGAYERSP